jgi:hypothetical protein
LAIRFETSRILLSVQIGGHNEAGFSAGIRDEAKHLFIAGQRLGSPAVEILRYKPETSWMVIRRCWIS